MTRCDWGSCEAPATETAWSYGETRPYCWEHGSLNRECERYADSVNRRKALTELRCQPTSVLVRLAASVSNAV